MILLRSYPAGHSVRCGFPGGKDVWLADVLNVGVRPERLIRFARARFEKAGGVIFESSPLAAVRIRPGAAVLQTRDGTELRARLVIDCMGQRSPIVAQVCACLEDAMHPHRGGCSDTQWPMRCRRCVALRLQMAFAWSLAHVPTAMTRS